MEQLRAPAGYEIIGELGEGGVARVFAARQTSTGRKVALKLLRDEFLPSKEVRGRLKREAMAVATIKSPHVCELYGFEVMGDEAFIAMEYVEGTTLRSLTKSDAWTPADISTVIAQIGEALWAAHQLGIVHRDLKPENVMLTGSGEDRRVKVLDFGFAKLIDAERDADATQLTRAGTCFGTPQYMSPEQVRGRTVDSRTDLFALGVMAYELLGGRRPFDGSDAREVMIAVATQAVLPLKRVRFGLAARAAQLNAFFARALHKDADKRPPDARTFVREFEEALGTVRNIPSQVPDDWFSEVSSAMINISELLGATRSSELPIVRHGHGAEGDEGDEGAAPIRSSWVAPIDSPDEVPRGAVPSAAPPAQAGPRRDATERVAVPTASPVHEPGGRPRWLPLVGIVAGLVCLATLAFLLTRR